MINKYLDCSKKNDFKFNDVKYSRPFFFEWDSERYNELFEYNKTYLKFEITDGGYRFGKYYFLKDDKEVFCVDESLSLEYGEMNTNTLIMNNDEVLSFFNSSSYDSMYIINREGYIVFASNKEDGTIIDMNIIPTDEEIIERDLYMRKKNLYLSKLFSVYTIDEKRELKSKLINDIREVPIYDKGMFNGYYHILVTSKDGKFSVNWMGLVFVEKGKYRLTLGNVPIMDPSIDDIYNYKLTNIINPAPFPGYDDEICFDSDEGLQKKLRHVKKL